MLSLWKLFTYLVSASRSYAYKDLISLPLYSTPLAPICHPATSTPRTLIIDQTLLCWPATTKRT